MTQTTSDLSGRTAIVTGAGKGLGRAYALHLAARGAQVVVNNRRHAGEADAQTSAQQVAQAIVDAGGRAVADWSDVADPASGEAMVQRALGTFGRLDIIVANAGIDHAATFHKQTLDDFRAIFDVGFLGNLHLAHAAWPQLLRQGYGRVVLTASSAGLYGNRGQAAYSAAKAAVIGLARVLALEGHKAADLRVNVVAPYGYSQMTAPYMPEAMARDFDPAQVAPLVGWLASEACDVTGEVLVCGAGLLRRAATGESAAVLLPAEVGTAVHALRERPTQAYPSASDSFAQLLQEKEQLRQRQGSTA